MAEGGAQSILDDINASTLPSGLPNVPDRYLVVTGTDGDRITEASVVTWRAALSADVPDSTAGKW